MIPFLDLKAQYADLKFELQGALAEVFENTSFVLGPAVEAFEENFAAYVGTKHAIAVNSGTSALHLSLLAAGVKPGDEVIAPAMTFIATVSAIIYAGGVPVLVDVDPETYTMNHTLLEAAITERTKVILPVHLYGHPADMDPILEIAAKRGIAVIEDAAQAHGAKYNGTCCGNIGMMGCFSFYPGKNLGACGEGGMVTTNDDDLARTIRCLRDWGQTTKGHHELKGYNYRMSGIQGAVLGVKLKHLNEWTEKRRRVGAVYTQLLENSGLVLPTVRAGVKHVYHVYAILAAQRDALRSRLGEAGVSTGVHYPSPIHLHPCFSEFNWKVGDFPVAERIALEELSLPIYPELSDVSIRLVVEKLREAMND